LTSAKFISAFAKSKEFSWNIKFELTFPFDNSEGQPLVVMYQTFREAAEAAGNSRPHEELIVKVGTRMACLHNKILGKLNLKNLVLSRVRESEEINCLKLICKDYK